MSHPEIGRELKVSELKPETIVVLMKQGRSVAATMWVIAVDDVFVLFRAGATQTDFLAQRCGEGLEQITDDDHIPMHVYEYLGEP
jgi:hypothetical protein